MPPSTFLLARIIALLALLCLLPSSASAYRGEIEPVEPRQYFETLKREIDNARASVTVCVYLFAISHSNPDSSAEKLASSLVAASRRGVRVEVILDQNIDFVEGFARSMEAKNLSAFDFLRANGVAVWFDSPGIYTHSKVAIIDGETVILGSGNWTEASFEKNMETNVLLRSKEAARDFLNQLSRVPRQAGPVPETAAVEIPLRLITRKGLPEGSDSKKLDYLLDVYALLLRKQKEEGSSEIFLDFDSAAKALGVEGLVFKKHRQRIAEAVKDLEISFGLLERLEKNYRNARVRLKPLQGEMIPVPVNFWNWGWHRRLFQSGKEFYILGLYYSAVSPNRPQWSRSGEMLAGDLHFHPGTVSEAVTALRRANLIEVRYDKNPTRPDEDREPNTYLMNPLYDPEELERAFKRLEDAHGRDKAKRAREWASVVYEDSDLASIEELIELESRRGQERIERAVEIVKEKSPSNPKRNIGYLFGTIDGLN